LLKTAPPRKDVKTSVVFTGPASAPRTIVVERKPSRRVVAADRAQRTALRSAG
jgi:tRNA pseudouridine-54 N-methylase